MKKSKNLRNLITLSLLTGIALTYGCKKEVPVTTVKVGSGINAPIPSYNFNWETATYLPSSPANQIPMPWNSGTTQINSDIVNDFKSADGWKLVYNTFKPTTPLTGNGMGYYFALYNQYRGVLRLYLWQPSAVVYTSLIQHGLNLYGSANSSMLNFGGDDIIDQNVPAFTNVLNQQINANGGTWFAFQYEMAYDPTIATTASTSLQLGWIGKYINITQLKLNGTIDGTATGTIGTEANSFDLDGTVKTAVKGGVLAIGVTELKKIPEANRSDLIKKLLSAASDLLGGTVKNFLSGLLGGSSGPGPQQVNIKLNANVEMAGTAVNNGGLMNYKLTMPGQPDSQTADGLTPIYNSTMGVVNLSAKPVLNFHVTGYSYDNSWGFPLYNFFATATVATVTPVVNPAVSALATVTLVNKEVILYDMGNTTFTTGTVEQASNHSIRSGASVSYSQYQYWGPAYSPPYFNAAVRCTFKVQPNNGTPATTIVKTFAANCTVN
ncbi:hypothetical protein IDJ77_15215 [Mucilaginibacter sp. ZT4R22]|uniref:Fimbrillin-like protein n=1 Tax=Mucilaginibacter pankratovii TaxID=2772110 RepID=A0ABR7WUT9_9SPHI|nr:hypothetical protein [Mucilaginibacter pankratovii]MBD1365164.1 hypothetical protein [Mucilaginibacter pankratovii]